MKYTLFVACLLCANIAHAELGNAREHARQMDSGKLALGAELSAFFGSYEDAGYAVVVPMPLAFFRLREAVFEAAMPLYYVHENNDPGSDHDLLGAGNPWFALSYLPDTSCGLARLSLGVAPELANGSTPRRARALSLSRGAQGGSESYLFLDRMLPLVFGAGTLKELSRLRLVWDGDVIVGLPGNGRDTELGMQTSGELALRFGWHTQVGTRATLAYYPTLPGDDFQSSIALVARHARPTGRTFAARFVVHLDGPLGFSFGDSGMWGLSLLYATSI